MIKRGAVLVAALVAIKAQALMNGDTPVSGDDTGGAWASSPIVGTQVMPLASAGGWSRHGAGAGLALLERDPPWLPSGTGGGSLSHTLREPEPASSAEIGRLLAHTDSATPHMSYPGLVNANPDSGWRRKHLDAPWMAPPVGGLGPTGGGVVTVPTLPAPPIYIYLPPGTGTEPGTGTGGGDSGSGSVPAGPIGAGHSLGQGWGAGGGGAMAPVPEADTWLMALAGAGLITAISRRGSATKRPAR